MRAAASGTGRTPRVPFPPCDAHLGVAGTLQLEEQLGDVAQGAGCPQVVPERAAQGSEQQVALHGLQGLRGQENTLTVTLRPPQRGLSHPSPPSERHLGHQRVESCQEVQGGDGLPGAAHGGDTRRPQELLPQSEGVVQALGQS